MGQLSAKLRNFTGPSMGGFLHWCPGCKEAHAIYTKNAPGRPTWSWDGNVTAPTCAPSIRCFTTYDAKGVVLPNGGQRTLCHYFLKAGKIEFCGDCEHALSGQKVDLPDFPPGYGGGDE